MFFNVPDDLTNLDVKNGQCFNSSVKQNVTFSYQGLPFGLSNNKSSAVVSARTQLGLIFAAFLGSLVWNLL